MAPENTESSNDNLWASLLNEVQSSRSQLPVNKSILFLGEKESGKSTLVAKLQGNEDPKQGAALEYGYIEVRDEYREEQTRLGHWILDGDDTHAHLLRFALKSTNISDTTAIICVSMSEPWYIMERLIGWTTVLHDHIDSLDIKADQTRSFRKKVINRWQAYKDPTESSLDGIGSPSMRMSRTLNTDEFTNDDDEEALIPLPEMTLTRNLGMDIVVVVTKTDVMSDLERDHEYNEEHFDYIQKAIREYCVSIGAALVYTSVKENKNCDVLYKYLTHKIYGFPFKTPALVVEKDAVFVPAGWDNSSKINILDENIHNMRMDLKFNEVIVTPSLRRTGVNREAEVVAEDETQFLQRQLNYLQQSPPTTRAQIASPAVDRRGVAAPSKKFSSDSSSPTTEKSLANFFNYLLVKKPGQSTISYITSSSEAKEESRTRNNAQLELERIARTNKETAVDKSTSEC